MRVAILETVKTKAGFELEYDRLIFEELKKQGHQPILYLPVDSKLNMDFGVPVEYMQGGSIVDYDGAGKLKKIWLSIQREKRRISWFNSAYEKAKNGEVDIILITTATYRYLRSLHKSKLKNSPIPIVFMFLGVNPSEMPLFKAQAIKCSNYENIKLKVTTLRDDFGKDKESNIEIIKPPVLVPQGVAACTTLKQTQHIKIGFFGHYRKGEKDINGIIQAFVDAKLGNKAELVVQTVPTDEADTKEIENIIGMHKNNENVSFINKRLDGNEWYAMLQSMDVLLLPYSDSRYLYNWSAVYFNAIGLYKPVLTTKFLNPEILQEYKIGCEVDLDNLKLLATQLKNFCEGYNENLPIYQSELKRANNDFGTDIFLQNILK